MAEWYFNDKMAKQDMDFRVLRELNRTAHELKPIIESFTPVLTGDMKRSWELEVQSTTLQILITNRMPYWTFVEMGTERMAARAPLRKGLAAYSRSSAGGSFSGAFSGRVAGKPRIFQARLRRTN